MLFPYDFVSLFFNLSLLQRKEKGIYQLHELIQEFLKNKQNNLANTDKQKHNLCIVITEKAKKIATTITLSNINELDILIPHLTKIATSHQN